VGAIEFRYQLRQRSAAWVPQDELDWGTRHCFARCHLIHFMATATAQLKYAVTLSLCVGKTILLADNCHNQAISPACAVCSPFLRLMSVMGFIAN